MANFPDAAGYPSLLMAGRSQPMVVTALSSLGFATRETTAADRVDAKLGNATRSILFSWGGYTELWAGSYTAAATLAAAETFADNRRAAGFDYIIGLTVPHSSSFSGAQDTERLGYNALLLASDSFDAVVDVAGDARMQDGSDLTYFSDGTHFTTAGAQVVADLCEPYLTAAL